jgi:haloacetate dehalogenase
MMDDFETAATQTGETSLFARWSGAGSPLLWWHGCPPTHLRWRRVAPTRARHLTVVCPALRGDGRSGCPASPPAHAPSAKRAMAQDLGSVMEPRGWARGSAAGHDRGGRVAYRLARDPPQRLDRLAVLAILPTAPVWDRAEARGALASGPGSRWAQPEPRPERLRAVAAEAVVAQALGGWGAPAAVVPPEGRRIACPLLARWSAGGPREPWDAGAGGPVARWHAWRDDGQGDPRKAGHFFPEEAPDPTADALNRCFATASRGQSSPDEASSCHETH